MAAPKGAGCFFGGDLQGGAETRRASAGPHARLAGNRLARQTKQNPARRRAWPAFLSRCLREHAGQKRSVSCKHWAVQAGCYRFVGRSRQIGLILHNGSITNLEVRWTLQKALTYRQ